MGSRLTGSPPRASPALPMIDPLHAAGEWLCPPGDRDARFEAVGGAPGSRSTPMRWRGIRSRRTTSPAGSGRRGSRGLRPRPMKTAGGELILSSFVAQGSARRPRHLCLRRRRRLDGRDLQRPAASARPAPRSAGLPRPGPQELLPVLDARRVGPDRRADQAGERHGHGALGRTAARTPGRLA